MFDREPAEFNQQVNSENVMVYCRAQSQLHQYSVVSCKLEFITPSMVMLVSPDGDGFSVSLFKDALFSQCLILILLCYSYQRSDFSSRLRWRVLLLARYTWYCQTFLVIL